MALLGARELRPSAGALRVGLVREQDAGGARVRVQFPDRDQMVSWWLPVVVAKSQNDKAYWIPDLGEQVLCLMDEYDEAGAVLGAIYSNTDAAPVNSPDKFHLAFKDGASFEYDRSTHVLLATFSDGATLKYDAAVGRFELSAGKVVILSSSIELGAEGGPAVARVGDLVDVASGSSAGQWPIVSGSAKVKAA